MQILSLNAGIPRRRHHRQTALRASRATLWNTYTVP
jgi:hypothetical protein